MHPVRTRSATVSLLTAALLVLGGVFLTSGSGSTPLTTAAGAAGAPGSTPIGRGADTYAVGVRELAFARGADRPLPTLVWYPTSGRRAKGRTVPDAAPLAGRFPLLVWSHGLHSNPQMQAGVAGFFASAGFVVAAPAYPYTKKDTRKYLGRPDIPNQALDASAVITALLDPASPLAAHVDPTRLGAGGHSGGGTTTNALFTVHRDPRLKVGLVVAGRPLGEYRGTPAPLLFLHGDRDSVVAYDQGRTAYAKVGWPKAFLTIKGGEHGAGLGDPERGHEQSMATMLDFLKWALDGDETARERLSADGTLDGVTGFESVGIYPSRSQPSTPSSTTTATTPPTINGTLAPVASG